MFKHFNIIFLLLFIFCSNNINAEPFDSMTVVLNLNSNFNNNDFHNYWEPKTGFEISGRTNFYSGMIELGITYNKNKSLSIDQPDYNSIYSFVGFGFNYKINNSFSNYIGLRMGDYYMDFDDPDIHPELKSEHEFYLGAITSVQYSLNKRYAFNLSLEHYKIFTYKRIYLWFVSVGVAYSFDSPKWLKEFLQ
ncbi:MAG: hypothetical protein DRP35_04310 [Candidatus Zixiibacteriota bacterium]|nr:MAG: hypothetical protein DRP35_04310 [candidate division Zixibacteria bacterium]